MDSAVHWYLNLILSSVQSIARVCRCTLQWRHNDHDGVSNHQPSDCLLNRLSRRRSNKTSKLRVTGLCAGNSPVTGEFPAPKASSAENVSTWWRHHGEFFCLILCFCFVLVICDQKRLTEHDLKHNCVFCQTRLMAMIIQQYSMQLFQNRIFSNNKIFSNMRPLLSWSFGKSTKCKYYTECLSFVRLIRTHRSFWMLHHRHSQPGCCVTKSITRLQIIALVIESRLKYKYAGRQLPVIITSREFQVNGIMLKL